MIEKQRLEELIEQGATIYELYMNKNILEIQLKTDWFVMQDGLYERKLSKHPFRSWQIGNLYETKEDAEFVREFGCIERTERLELPSWEEVQKNSHTIWFTSPSLKSYRIYFYCDKIELEEQDEEYLEVFSNLIACKLTKENYKFVCKKCKELFLGENNDKENS